MADWKWKEQNDESRNFTMYCEKRKCRSEEKE